MLRETTQDPIGFLGSLYYCKLGCVAQSVAFCLNSQIPDPAHTFVETDHKICPLPLVLEGQLSDTGKNMGT